MYTLEQFTRTNETDASLCAQHESLDCARHGTDKYNNIIYYCKHRVYVRPRGSQASRLV